MEVEQHALEGANSAAADQLHARQEEADRHVAQYERDKSEFEAARLELQQEQERLREEHRESSRRFGERLSELEQLRLELARERADFKAEREAWQRQSGSSSATDQDQITPPREVKPILQAPIEIEPEAEVERLEEIAEAEEEATQEMDLEETVEVEPIQREPREVPAAPKGSDEEQSIEEYMAALLHRTRGAASPVAPVVTPAPKRNKRKADAESTAEPKPATELFAVAKPDHQRVVDMPFATTEMTRRSPAEGTDLKAMRVIANLQTRSAIDTHGKKRLMKTALATSTAAVASLLATILVLQITDADDHAIRTGAMAGMVAAVFWIYSASLAARQLFSSNRAREEELQANIDRAAASKAAEANPEA